MGDASFTERFESARDEYLDRLARRSRLGADAKATLIEAAKQGDQSARARLIEEYLPRIASLARRYSHAPHVEQLELVQEGVAGLLLALERYDPGRGTPLWAHAEPYVRRAMQRLVAELGDAVRLPDRALRHLSRLKGAEDELMQETHRGPPSREIVARAGMSHEAAERLLAAVRPPRSLQEPVTAEDGGVIGSLGDQLDDPSATDGYDRVLDAAETHELLSLLSVLSDRERAILRAHDGLEGEPESRREIAQRLGVSPRRVREIERRARAKIASQRRRSDGREDAQAGL